MPAPAANTATRAAQATKAQDAAERALRAAIAAEPKAPPFYNDSAVVALAQLLTL
jgi:rubrerythrin